MYRMNQSLSNSLNESSHTCQDIKWLLINPRYSSDVQGGFSWHVSSSQHPRDRTVKEKHYKYIYMVLPILWNTVQERHHQMEKILHKNDITHNNSDENCSATLKKLLFFSRTSCLVYVATTSYLLLMHGNTHKPCYSLQKHNENHVEKCLLARSKQPWTFWPKSQNVNLTQTQHCSLRFWAVFSFQ